MMKPPPKFFYSRMRLVWRFLLLIACLICFERFAFSEDIGSSNVKGYRPVCQKTISAIDHDLSWFIYKFGPAVSQKKLTTYRIPSQLDQIGTVSNIHFDGLTVIYLNTAGLNKVLEIDARSPAVLSILGFNVSTLRNIEEIFGKPDEEGNNFTRYRCEFYEIMFHIADQQIMSATLSAIIN